MINKKRDTIILPIRKQYSDLIFSGKKKCEYRKRLPKLNVRKVFVYEARGCGMIIGEIIVKEILKMHPTDLWEQTKGLGCVDITTYTQYFSNTKIAHAILINEIIRYDKPKSLKEFGLSHAPQSYIWV